MSWGQQRRGAPAWNSGERRDTVRLQVREAAGGGRLPAGERFFVGEDPRSGDVLAVFRLADSKEQAIVVQRVCRISGKTLAESEFKPIGAAGWGLVPAEGEAEQAPQAWMGPGGWKFSFREGDAVLERAGAVGGAL